MNNVIISLGSNLPNADKVLDRAEHVMRLWFRDVQFSARLLNPAIGLPKGVHDFTNQLAFIRTGLSQHDILSLCKNLEHMLGNTKEKRSRHEIVIDADLVEYGNIILKPKDAGREYYVKLKTSENKQF